MNKFYKPTPIYKEFQILNLIANNETITQRIISDELNIALSMVNKYLKEYEEEKYITIKNSTDKKVEYNLTQKGEDRIRFLNIGYLSSSNQVYDEARRSVLENLEKVLEPGTKSIIIYGAGEVASIIVDVLQYVNTLKIKAIIDDNSEKQSQQLGGIEISSNEGLKTTDADEFLISTYKQQDVIKNKLNNLGIFNTKQYFPKG
jgi:DNA-binding MarR family transcriptional regulator